jgi:UDP-N-acetylmuramate dehydrogenase
VSVGPLIASGVLRPDVPLAAFTTYRLGGRAAWFAEPRDEDELGDVLRAARELGRSVVVLGRGSNVIVSDNGIDSVVVHLVGSFVDVEVVESGVVTAGGGAPLAKVARSSVEADRGGLEFLVGIPGSVGGAVRMNAGCLGTETADVLIDARIVGGATGVVTTHTAEDLAMAYRSSSVGPGDIVVSARFRTQPQLEETGRIRIREVTQWRREHQPGGTLNAGSVFKNPPGDAAGRIIDSLGLKGLRCGGAVVSSRHANFIEADPGTTAQDLFDLTVAIQTRVADETGIALETEIKFLGEFSDANAKGRRR